MSARPLSSAMGKRQKCDECVDNNYYLNRNPKGERSVQVGRLAGWMRHQLVDPVAAIQVDN